MTDINFLYKKELEKYRNDSAVVNLITSIIRDLNVTEVLKFLRLKGRVFLKFADNPIQNAALQAAHSSGYQQALDDLEHFVDFFITAPATQANFKSPTATFGAISSAINRGDISKEDLDKLKAEGRI